MSAFPLVLAALVACVPPSRPRLNEVLYDAAGDDTGREYVELLNTGDAVASLAGLRIEAGDGSAPGRWTLRWTGGARDSLAPGARFVVGGAAVTPAPDRVATLDLQNGPDAVRLVWPDGGIETLGWGALEHAEYFCGSPAPDVPGGRALARLDESAPALDNASDFREADPSPGSPNRRTHDAALVRGSLRLAPAQPAPGGTATLALALANVGATDWPAGACVLRIDGDVVPRALEQVAPALAAGETTRVEVSLADLPRGRGRVVARAVLTADGAPANDADTLLARVGPGPLAIVEVQFHPTAGEGEWVEVRNVAGVPLALDMFRLGDRSGATGALEPGPALPPDSLAVFAQDAVALRARWPGIDPARVRRVQPWSALNNTDDAAGVADEVVIVERDGVPVERIAYSASGVASGVTLERIGDTWRPGPLPDGTPLAAPRPADAVPGGFRVEPRRLAHGEGTMRFAWELPWPESRVTLELYDLDGRRTRRLVGPLASGAQGERRLSLGTLEPGIHLAVLRAESDAGALTRVAPFRVEDRP